MANFGRRIFLLTLTSLVLISYGHSQVRIGSEGIGLFSSSTVASGHQPEIEIRADSKVRSVDLRAFRIANPAEFLFALRDRRSIEEPAKGVELEAVNRVIGANTPVATWTVTLKPRKANDDRPAQTTTVPVRDSGMYLVEAKAGDKLARTVVFVSDIILNAQGIRSRGVVAVVDRRTGAPLADVNIDVLHQDNNKQTTLRTDKSGTTKVDFPHWTSAVFVAQRGMDVAAIANPKSSEWPPEKPELIQYLYTDRPVYRPGDTAHFKAILRDISEQGLTVPTSSEFQAVVRNPQGKVLTSQNLSASKMGTLWGDIKIPLDAKLGNYIISVGPSGKGSNTSTAFAVEEFKTPQIKVELQSDRPHVVQGDTIHLLLKAQYYFGQPVPSARVDYQTYVYTQSSPDDADSGRAHLARPSETAGSGPGVLKQGEFRFDIPTAPSKDGNVIYLVKATVRDENGDAVMSQTSVLATEGTFSLSATPDRFLYHKGENAVIAIRTVDYDDRPVAAPVQVELVPAPDPNAKALGTAAKFSVNTGETGSTSVSVPLPDAGQFLLRASAAAAGERQLEVVRSITVLGGIPDQYQTESYTTAGTLIMDKAQYREGETARIALVSRLPDLYYLLSVETQGEVDFYGVHASGNTAEFRLPLRSKHSPNFFVVARAFKDGKRVLLSSERDVDLAAHRLNIQVIPTKDKFRPGEQATVTVRTTDSKGKPQAAELSLGVVDSAIYAVKPDTASDIVKVFYPKRKSKGWWQDSLSFEFRGGAYPIGVIGGVPGGMFGGVIGGIISGTPGTFVAPTVRKNFSATAYWVADTHTDKRGEATVQFTLPDTLTTWRTTARGSTQTNLFGSFTKEVVSQKNILVRLSVPRFLRVGDEVTISVLAHNYLPRAKKVRVSLDPGGLEILNGDTRDIEIASGSQAKLDWRVRASVPMEAKLLAKALTDEESDAVEIPLPVEPLGTKLNVGYSGMIGPDQTEGGAIIFIPKTPTRSLKISTTPSLVASTMNALEYLTSYPHGCTEQLMSSFLPDVIVASSVKQLPIISDVNREELEKKVYSGLAQLYKTQHESGAWGWWPTDQDHPFMTAYVIAGLSQAGDAGYPVDSDALDRGSRWLANRIDSRQDPPDLRAYMLYALSFRQPEASQRQALWDERRSLTPHGKSLLGLALLNARDPRVQQLVDDVVAAAQVAGNLAHWDGEQDLLLRAPSNYDVETTATAVRFLARSHAQTDLLPKAVNWLMAQRDQGDHWLSTKQTSTVIFALAEFLKTSNEFAPDGTLEVLVNGKSVATRKFADPYAQGLAGSIVVDDSKLLPGQNTLTIRKTGRGTVYWSAVADYYSPQSEPAQIANHDLMIARSYFLVTENSVSTPDIALLQSLSRGVWIKNYESRPLNGPLKRGDILAVRLSVVGSQREYLMIEDPIPAGTELLQSTPGLNRSLTYRPQFDGSESHDDRMDFFRTGLEGSEDFVYFLRVLNPGKFKVNPARVEPMYEPGVVSTSPMTVLEIQ